MAERCINCRLNKRKVFFDIDKAIAEAKVLAVQTQKSYAIIKEGKAIRYTEAAGAVSGGLDIIQVVSKYI
jgi:hypothetical protein